MFATQTTLSFDQMVEKIKAISGAETLVKVAEELGLKADALGQRKKRGAIPDDKIILFCIKHNISLDEFYNLNPHKQIKNNEGVKTETLQLIGQKEKITIPFTGKTENLAAFGHGNKTYIIDESINKFSTDGIYLFHIEDSYQLKSIEQTLSGKYLVKSSVGGLGSIQEITKENLDAITIVGIATQEIVINNL